MRDHRIPHPALIATATLSVCLFLLILLRPQVIPDWVLINGVQILVILHLIGNAIVVIAVIRLLSDE